MTNTSYYFEAQDDKILDDYLTDYIKQLFNNFPPNEAAKILMEYADNDILEDAKKIAKDLFPKHANMIDAYLLLK